MDIDTVSIKDAKTTLKKTANQNITNTTNNVDTVNTINGISFTNREIDIIACLLTMTSSKKIGHYLSVSHKTVEVHLRNIMIKINTNSRNEILEFVNKFDKTDIVKKHYIQLSVRINFNNILCQIGKLIPVTSAVVFNYKTQNNEFPDICQLETYLRLANIKLIIKTWEKGKSLNYIFNVLRNTKINFIIYNLSDSFNKQLQLTNSDLELELNNLTLQLPKDSTQIILLSNQQKPNFIQTESNKYMLMSLNEQNNYYSLIFKLLQKMFPHLHDKLEKHWEQFTANNKFSFNVNYTSNNNQTPQTQTNRPLNTKFNDGNNLINKFIKIKNIVKKCLPLFTVLVTMIYIILMLNEHFHFLWDTTKKVEVIIDQNNTTSALKTISSKKNSLPIPNSKDIIALNIPPKNKRFIGRTAELQQLSEQFNKHSIGITTQTISGLGGVGKTQLVTEFVYQLADKKKYSTILWISAETNENIQHSYETIARLLNIDTKGFKFTDIQEMVHQYIIKANAKPKLLFILDNITNYQQFNDFVTILTKQIPTTIPVNILLTSRSQYWPESSLHLESFSKADAISFVKNHLAKETNEDVGKLITTFHNFPLALNQAVAYIQKHTNINNYLQLYSNNQNFSNQIDPENTTDKQLLWNTWALSLNKLNKITKEILFISAFLCPDNISFDLFNHLDLKQVEKSINELREYSLITLTSSNTFKIHRLLQETIRRSTYFPNSVNKKPEEYWLNLTINLLRKKFDFNYANMKSWHNYSSCLTHLHYFIKETLNIRDTKQQINKDIFQQTINLYSRLALYMTYVKGELLTANQMYQNILNLLEPIYKKEQHYPLLQAIIYSHLSFIFTELGKLKQGEEYALKANLIYEQNYKKINKIPLHIETILNNLRLINSDELTTDAKINLDYSFALNSLGFVKSFLGEIETAQNLYVTAIKHFNNYNTYKNDILLYKTTYLINLITAYSCKGELHQANQVKADLHNMLDAFKKHNYIYSRYLYVSSSLAKYNCSDFSKAIELLQECLIESLPFYSKEHYYISRIKQKIGLILCSNGKFSEGIEYFKQVENIIDQYYTDDNYRKLTFYLHMGYAYETGKNYKKAMCYYKKSSALFSPLSKEQKNGLLALKSSPQEILANIHIPKSPQEIKFYQETFKLLSSIFGREHFRLTRYHYLLGQIDEQNKIYKNAKQHYQTALNIIYQDKSFEQAENTLIAKNIETLQQKINSLQNK